jgi:phosphoglucomutase
MPAKSDRQRRYLYAKFGAAWVKRHHFERVESAKSRQGGRRLRQVARKSAR